jgi:prophage DNA circulation protein
MATTWITERSRRQWRLELLTAMFKNAPFHIESGSMASGRRVALHEYPKRDLPYAEDMGRKAVVYDITGYIIENDKLIGRGLGGRAAQFLASRVPDDQRVTRFQREVQFPELPAAETLDYRVARNVLIAALDSEGPGTLIHPTLPELQVMCQGYSVTESRDKGGFCVFQMRFVEYGRPANLLAFVRTQEAVQNAVTQNNVQSAQAFQDLLRRWGLFGLLGN